MPSNLGWVDGFRYQILGDGQLSKLGSTLRIPIKTDQFARDKTRLNYARLLIDIPIKGDFPNFVDFINDQDVVMRVQLEYEWRPIKCQHCKMYGHSEVDCRKKTSIRQEWRKVQMKAAHVINIGEPSTQISGRDPHTTLGMDDEGFTPIQRQAARHFNIPSSSSDVVRTYNSFGPLQVLQEEHDDAMQREGGTSHCQNMQLEH